MSSEVIKRVKAPLPEGEGFGVRAQPGALPQSYWLIERERARLTAGGVIVYSKAPLPEGRAPATERERNWGEGASPEYASQSQQSDARPKAGDVADE